MFAVLLFAAMVFTSWGVGRSVYAQGTRVQTVRSASGALTAADTSDALDVTGYAGLIFTKAVITLDVTTLTLADADDEVDFYIQTTYDGGTNWVDTENIHFDSSDNGATAKRVIVIDGALDGPGSIKSIVGTDPAAGNEISETVPANAMWILQSIKASLATDAAVVNRKPTVTLDDGTNAFFKSGPFTSQTASLTVPISWSKDGFWVSSLNTISMVGHLPATVLSAGYRMITVTDGIQAGDNWGVPQLLVEEWHDPLVLTDGTIRDNVKSYMRPLGSEIRIKTTVTGATAGTYAYSASVLFQ